MGNTTIPYTHPTQQIYFEECFVVKADLRHASWNQLFFCYCMQHNIVGVGM